MIAIVTPLVSRYGRSVAQFLICRATRKHVKFLLLMVLTLSAALVAPCYLSDDTRRWLAEMPSITRHMSSSSEELDIRLVTCLTCTPASSTEAYPSASVVRRVPLNEQSLTIWRVETSEDIIIKQLRTIHCATCAHVPPTGFHDPDYSRSDYQKLTMTIWFTAVITRVLSLMWVKSLSRQPQFSLLSRLREDIIITSCGE